MAERTCELCGAPLLKKPGRAGTPTRWCSTPCRRVADAARSRAYYANQPRKPQATLPDIECAGCGVMFPPTGHQGGGPPQKWCTGACRARWKRANDPTILERQRVRRGVRPARWREAERKLAKAAEGTHGGRTVLASGPCSKCDTTFTTRVPTGHTARFCSTGCAGKGSADARRRARQRRRARERGAFVVDVSPQAIYERDRWTCQLCGQRILRTTTYPAPLSPSIDHIVPLAKGGTHEPANVQAAHFLCNSRKGDRATEDQLRLIG